MGFLGKFFEKKECSICGGPIGLMGNKKLEDGNMCKDCAAKLSPFFSERKNSAVAQIQEQLAYREANKAEVEAFHTDRSLGNITKVLIDDTAGKFMVTDSSNLAEANPDVIALSDVTNCRLDINESRHEITYNDKDGKKCHYNPARYEYKYDFFTVINVRNPYFDEIRFKLNKHAIHVKTGGGSRMTGNGLTDFLNTASAILTSGYNPRENVEYQEYENMGNDIIEALTGRRPEVN